MRPGATLKRIARDIEPLAAWLHQHKPDCPAITLQGGDVSALRANADAARRHGFTVTPEAIHYSGFLIRSSNDSELPS